MPKYEYACKSCGERLEVVQTFADDPLTDCPACGGPLRKVFSAPSIAFKGSGFYRTDNRKRRTEPVADPKPEKVTADTKAATTASESTSESSTPAPAKTETKPAAETKPKAAEAKTA